MLALGEELRRCVRQDAIGEMGADAGLLELLDQDFLALHHALIGIAEQIDVDTIWIAGLGQKLSRLIGIMRIGVRQ